MRGGLRSQKEALPSPQAQQGRDAQSLYLGLAAFMARTTRSSWKETAWKVTLKQKLQAMRVPACHRLASAVNVVLLKLRTPSSGHRQREHQLTGLIQVTCGN